MGARTGSFVSLLGSPLSSPQIQQEVVAHGVGGGSGEVEWSGWWFAHEVCEGCDLSGLTTHGIISFCSGLNFSIYTMGSIASLTVGF